MTKSSRVVIAAFALTLLVWMVFAYATPDDRLKPADTLAVALVSTALAALAFSLWDKVVGTKKEDDE